MAANATRRDILRYALGAAAAAVTGQAVLGTPHATAYSDKVNVRDYGAVGDGVADDRAAIHAARDAAGVGGTLIFPKGTYRVQTLATGAPGYKFGAGGLWASVANQTWLLGAATLVLNGGKRENLITISAPNVSIVGGVLDLSAIQPEALARNVLSHGVAVWSGRVATNLDYGVHGGEAAGAVIDGVFIKDAPGYGVFIFNTNSVTVTGCTITDFVWTGIMVQNGGGLASEKTDIHDFLIHGNRLESTWASFASCIYVGANDQGGTGYAAKNQRVRRARITGNSCVIPRGIYPGQGSFFDGGAEAGAIQMVNADDCVIDGNVTDGGAMGITTGFLRRTVISNNTCRGWRGIGIEVSLGLDQVTVAGNIVDSEGAGGPFNAVSGIPDATGSLGQSVSGILSSGAAAFTNYTIAENTITGFTTSARAAGILLYNSNRPSAGGAFESVMIRGNTITAGGGSQKFSGISAHAPSTNLAITGNTIDGASRIGSSGIEIAESTHDQILISGNNFSNCSVAAVSTPVPANGVVTNMGFAGNLVRNCGASIKTIPS